MSATNDPAASRVRVLLPREGFTLDVDLELPPRGITVVHGASGSGKTSLLRVVAGLERDHASRQGFVSIAGQVWQDDARGVFVPTWQRPLGFVFQESSLFEHLDVAANLAYGLRRAGKPRTALDAAITLLGIGELLHRRPTTLSGGERQRVAIARALALEPALLLLDEPLASIDRARRGEILPWLERLRDETSVPMLYVTHDADELARLADHLVLLERGRALASGPTARVLEAQGEVVFMGDDAGVLLEGRVGLRDDAWHLARIDIDGGAFWVRDAGLAVGHAVRVRVLARDVSLALHEPRATSIQNLLRGVVESVVAEAHPSQARVRVRCGAATLLARVTRRSVAALQLDVGVAVWVQVKAVALIA